MPDLLLELFSEEIPARMQARAAEDLRRLVTDGLVAQGFVYEGARTFVTPRRLTLAVQGLPAKGRDVREEKKGPRVGAPQAAIDGFLRSAGLTSIDQATVQSDPKKGDSYIAVIEKPGRSTADVLAEMLPGVIRAFPWPKSMRWGASSGPEGKSYVLGQGKGAEALRWVRPLRSILCTFGSEHEEPEVIRFEVDAIASGNVTFGHRFMSDGAPIAVKRLDDYLAKLEAAKVIADPARRKEIVVEKAKELCFVHGLELVEDEALADEVAGLVEWPVPLMGAFEPEFLEVPAEAIRATIRANQKCFVVRAPSPRLRGEGGGEGPGESGATSPGPSSGAARHLLPAGEEKEGSLAPNFIATANVEAADGGATIIAGNGRVIRARLSDARFFWQTDRKVRLEERLEKLKSVRFHEKLGTQYERVERIAALAEEIAPLVGADPKLARRAAMLAKADLATEMVGEFPELQGLMGRYYAALEGEPAEVAAAIEEHYKPQGPSDRVPTAPVSIAVALADKLDTLVGFWAIDEKPTGSKDPYALRRAALGVIRLVVENGIEIRISMFLASAVNRCPWLPYCQHKHRFHYDNWNNAKSLTYHHEIELANLESQIDQISETLSTDLVSKMRYTASEHRKEIEKQKERAQLEWSSAQHWYENEQQALRAFVSCAPDLLSFFHDRLKVMLREQGARHDLVDAVLGAGSSLPPVGRVARSEAEGREGGTPTSPADVTQHSSEMSRDPLPAASPPPSPQGGGMGANDDLLSIVNRVSALSALLSSEDGANLLAGYRRAASFLRDEEKNDGNGAFEGSADAALLAEPEEMALASALDAAEASVTAHLATDDYAGAMQRMAELRPAVDAFLDKIRVNAEDRAVRANRLKLLAALRRVTAQVADFGRIAG